MTDKEIKEHAQVIKLALIAQGVTRMANYMEEIMRMVKTDQERASFQEHTALILLAFSGASPMIT